MPNFSIHKPRLSRVSFTWVLYFSSHSSCKCLQPLSHPYCFLSLSPADVYEHGKKAVILFLLRVMFYPVCSLVSDVFPLPSLGKSHSLVLARRMAVICKQRVISPTIDASLGLLLIS